MFKEFDKSIAFKEVFKLSNHQLIIKMTKHCFLNVAQYAGKIRIS